MRPGGSALHGRDVLLEITGDRQELSTSPRASVRCDARGDHGKPDREQSDRVG
jgi:hypothetical protein